MFAIGPILSSLMLIKKIPWIFKLLRNWKAITEVIENTKAIFESAKNNGGLPTCDDSKKILDNVDILFRSGLIDFEGLDELQFSDFIREVNSNIVCSIDQGQRFKKS